MKEQKKLIEETTDNIKSYFNTYYELRILQLAEKCSNAGAEIMSYSYIFLMIMLSVLFLSLALAYYFSFSLIGDGYTGFIIVGGAYILLGIILYVFRKKIFDRPIRNKIIHALFKEEPLSSYLPNKIQ
jgi:hypothetical protein